MYYEALAAGAGGDWWHVVILQAPLGATVNVTDGDEDIDTVGTGEPMAIPVHDENSTYDITVDATGFQWTAQFNTTSVSGGYEFIDIDYGTIHLTFDDEFRGLTLTVSDGGSNTGTFTAPATGNTVDVFVPALGTWTISGTVGSKQYDSRPVTISDYAVAQSTKLILVPVGKTVLPTDDIETWLLCGEIKDKNYTTLDEVLADEATLIKLLTNDNAIDYMKRSTTWIVNPGLVPLMIDNTHPSGKAFAQSEYSGGEAYKAFDNDDTTYPMSASTMASGYYVGYHFTSDKNIKKLRARSIVVAGTLTCKLQYSTDSTTGSDGTWNDASDQFEVSNAIGMVDIKANVDVNASWWRIYVVSSTTATYNSFATIQFYEKTAAITESETAMSYIGTYDYAAEELLDDPVWNAGIMASEYWEDVLQGLVPTMTSNTTPCGEAFSYEPSTSNPRPAYYTFDKNGSTNWSCNDAAASSNPYVGYDFGHQVCINKIALSTTIGVSKPRIKDFEVQASNTDKTSGYITLYSGSFPTTFTDNVPEYFNFNNSDSYRYYRVVLKNAYETSYYLMISELQFYGRATGSVQSWLCAAGIAKPYTTMDEVLADHETLAALMTNHNAVDYLVTAKNLIPDIIADERAMFYIGRRNYAADSLIADEEWAKAIANSEYWESVFNASVPQMTSNIEPSGQCIANSVYAAGWDEFKAFDRDLTTCWIGANNDIVNNYIGYEFPRNVKVKVVKGHTENFSTSTGSMTGFKVQGYGSSGWEDLATYNDPSSSFDFCIYLNNNTEYSKYRLLCTSIYAGRTYLGVQEIQFCGREDVDETKITIRGAAGANIYKKVSGVDVPITTLVGTTDEVTKAQILGSGVDAGEVVIYSDVANDPDSLSNDYHKGVKVDDNTIDIDVMPDNSLYWYGHEDGNLEIISTANGWTAVSGWSYTNPSKSTAYMAFDDRNTSNCISGVGTKNKVKASAFNIHMLNMGIALTRSSSDGVTSHAVANKSKNYYDLIDGNTNYRITNSLADSVLRYSRTYEPIKKDAWISAYSYSAGCARMYGLWLSKHNPAANFFSAANDTVYYVSGGAQVVFAETNDLGEAVVDFSKIPAGDYILYSSVADDPDNLNLNQKYHKQITVEEDMRYRKIYLMPDGEVLYWYGYVGENGEVASTANGWTPNTGYSFINPTFNSDYAVLYGGGASAGKVVGFGTKKPASGRLHSILKCTASSISIRSAESKDFNASFTEYNTLSTLNVIQKVSLATKISNSIFNCYNAQERNGNMYALWIEP